MIKQIENLPEKILGFEFSSEVSANDYEKVVFPVIENQVKQKSKIKLIFQFNKNVKFDLGAMWDDASIGLKYFRKWEKIAVVSNISWINNACRAMSFLMPGHLRIYSNKEMQKAIDWLKEN